MVFFGEVGEGVEGGAWGARELVPGLGVEGFVGEAEVVGDGVDDEECEVGDGRAGGVEGRRGGRAMTEC